MNNKKYSLLNLVRIIWENKKIISITISLVLILSIVAGFILPKQYKSSATIVLPQEEEIGMGMLSSVGLGQLGSSGTLGKLESILKTQNLKQKVIQKFNLKEKYKAKNYKEALKIFSSNLNFVRGEEEIALTIEFFCEDRLLVEDITRYIVHKLDSINSNLSQNYSTQKKEFLKVRLNQIRDSLKSLSNNLQNTMEKNNIISAQKQAEASSQLASTIISQITKKEIELATLQASMTSSPKVNLLKTQIKSLQEKYNETINSGERYEIFPKFKKYPSAIIKIEKIRRKIDYYSNVIKYMGPKYEKAKLEELKNIPTIQVIDEPKTPIEAAKPRRIIIVFAGFIFSLVLSAIIVRIKYIMKELKEENRS